MTHISILHLRVRELVEKSTSWNAPIIWEGMFDSQRFDQAHMEAQSAVALTVFAVGRLVSPLTGQSEP